MKTSEEKYIYFLAHMLDEAMTDGVEELRSLSDTEKKKIIEKIESADDREYLKNVSHFDFFTADDFLFVIDSDLPENGTACILYVAATVDKVSFTSKDTKQDLKNVLPGLLDRFHGKLWFMYINSRDFLMFKPTQESWCLDNLIVHQNEFNDVFNVLTAQGMNTNLGIDHVSITDDAEDNLRICASKKCNADKILAWVKSKQKSSVQKTNRSLETSYLKYWKDSSPKNSLNAICRELSENFDRRLIEVFGSLENVQKIIEEKVLPEINNLKSWDVRDIVDEYFLECADRKSWWDLIPDQVYKAIVSRSRATFQGKLSRGVSKKTIYDCLDKICKDTVILYLQSTSKYLEKILTMSKTYKAVLNAVRREIKSDASYTDISILMKSVFECVSSYIDKTNTGDNADDDSGREFDPANDTSEYETFQRIFQTLNEIKYDSDELKLIAGISKAIDHFHYRGSLAGVFVEGGSKTCSAVSHMKPDELYERLYEKMRV